MSGRFDYVEDNINIYTYIYLADLIYPYGRNILMKIYPYGRFDHVEDISIFTNDFVINYNKNSDFGYTLIVYVDYPEYLQPLHKDLLFLHQKIVINKEKKAACTFYKKKKLSGSGWIILTWSKTWNNL